MDDDIPTQLDMRIFFHGPVGQGEGWVNLFLKTETAEILVVAIGYGNAEVRALDYSFTENSQLNMKSLSPSAT